MNVQVMSFGQDVDFEQLKASVDWAQRSVRVYGKNHPQPRLTRWYGATNYQYSGLTWEAAPLPSLLGQLKARVEALTGARFNCVLCNLYRDGQDTVGWHADDEPLFGGDPVVASLSFGASRTFKLKRKDGTQRVDFDLHNGTLLLMGRGTQTEWLHSVPRTKAALGERINLTFRYAMNPTPCTRPNELCENDLGELRAKPLPEDYPNQHSYLEALHEFKRWVETARSRVINQNC